MENGFRQNKESICTVKTVLDTQAELGVERDFVLPDYYPDIFRVLKCTVTPAVCAQSINGSRLSFEAEALIRILYLSEGDRRINCIEQKAMLSKAFDIDTGGAELQCPEVKITLNCDYVNCRVVNRRRLDIRGAVTAWVKVCSVGTAKVLTNAFGEGIQLKKQLITYPVKRLSASKRITVIEELSLSPSKPPLGAVLRSDCTVAKGEEKMIAGKLITKGEAQISLLYSCVDSSGSDTAETMKFDLPFSQIIDIDGIDEDFEADIDITPAGCTVLPKGESGTELDCELILNVSCTAVKFATAEAVTDAYSTRRECTLTQCEERIEAPSVKLEAACMIDCALSYGEGGIGVVYDCFAKCSAVNLRREGKKAVLSATVTFTAIGANEEGQPFMLENTAPLQHELELPEGTEEQSLIELKAEAAGVSYYLTDKGGIDAKADIRLSGRVRGCFGGSVLSNIELTGERPKAAGSSCALKLCRCTGSDDIWEIAKRCCTSVRAIEEENPEQSEFLLIPISE